MVDVTPIPKPPKREKKPRKPLKRSWLNPMSDKRRDELPERARVRQVVFDRDGHRCILRDVAASVDWLPACGGRLKTFHHLRKASGLGGYTEENGVTLCSRHNGWVEDEPKLAEGLGLVIR